MVKKCLIGALSVPFRGPRAAPGRRGARRGAPRAEQPLPDGRAHGRRSAVNRGLRGNVWGTVERMAFPWENWKTIAHR